jgi:hypothetical protein
MGFWKAAKVTEYGWFAGSGGEMAGGRSPRHERSFLAKGFLGLFAQRKPLLFRGGVGVVLFWHFIRFASDATASPPTPSPSLEREGLIFVSLRALLVR